MSFQNGHILIPWQPNHMTKGSLYGQGLGLLMTLQVLELIPFGSLANVKSFQNSPTLGHFFEPL
jgi:hypothetical protein